ncbi:hypothetical protein AB1Y20_004557 [Prymnesium parvum]|uniref:Heterokaryon incompatibility domain-containing protein n=1 Tax=Prymnesium parvum TaxID=97485 RepID=A0AB34IXV3_PRYPA
MEVSHYDSSWLRNVDSATLARSLSDEEWLASFTALLESKQCGWVLSEGERRQVLKKSSPVQSTCGRCEEGENEKMVRKFGPVVDVDVESTYVPHAVEVGKMAATQLESLPKKYTQHSSGVERMRWFLDELSSGKYLCSTCTAYRLFTGEGTRSMAMTRHCILMGCGFVDAAVQSSLLWEELNHAELFPRTIGQLSLPKFLFPLLKVTYDASAGRPLLREGWAKLFTLLLTPPQQESFPGADHAFNWVPRALVEQLAGDGRDAPPFEEVSSELLEAPKGRAVVLSWRWQRAKPPTAQGPSPLIKEVLQSALSKPWDCIWIDWMCVPQYGSNPMPHILSSGFLYSHFDVIQYPADFQYLIHCGPRAWIAAERIYRQTRSSLDLFTLCGAPSLESILCLSSDQALEVLGAAEKICVPELHHVFKELKRIKDTVRTDQLIHGIYEGVRGAGARSDAAGGDSGNEVMVSRETLSFWYMGLRDKGGEHSYAKSIQDQPFERAKLFPLFLAWVMETEISEGNGFAWLSSYLNKETPSYDAFAPEDKVKALLPLASALGVLQEELPKIWVRDEAVDIQYTVIGDYATS